MTLQNVLPWILRAQPEGWAVGAFNTNNLEQVQAVFWAAQSATAQAEIVRERIRFLDASSKAG